MLDYQGFITSLGDPAPPLAGPLALRALWYDAAGRPDSAARAAAGDDSHSGLRVRAYLARKAGDADAARHWYWHCGMPAWSGSNDAEWRDIVHTILVQQVVEQAYT